MDKYDKVKKIGEGSFGKAILVKSKGDGRQYVIKEIGIYRMSHKERQESRKEVAVLANMSHPNIVQYKESFEEGGCLYIVMDYCEGGDLFQKINSQKAMLFPEEQILDWFVQICLALKHVHDRKILHRDIKSQNIFLTKEGTVQLGDFGIARVLNSTVELARTCIGTPYYLSPEICENKPYNNKSDVWALGCVLYEMCTLKHAFEAGNMKNLVLKIIRGSYPPVSVHYSQELRFLLAQLLKRDPKERPSVSGVLDMPFLSCRIEKFLSPQIIAQEFRHTIRHKQPKVYVAQVPAAQKITKPACKYGVPLTVRRVPEGAKKPTERKPAVKRKPNVNKKKRMELKEKKQREQLFLLKVEPMKMYEKEKINRINQAREQGWKHILSSSGGSSPEKKGFIGGKKRAACAGRPVSAAVPCPSPVVVFRKNPYAHYHAALDQMAKQPKDISRQGCSAAPRSPARVPAAAGPMLPDNPAQIVSKCTHITRQVEEFVQRKKEAMLNKARAEGQLGTRHNVAAILGCRAGAGRCRRPKANKDEEEYLARLRQIRLQNFNERQQIKARLLGEKYDSQESSEEAKLRRKKIEALKAQANARAAVLKEQLEKKRREAHEREKKAWEDHLGAHCVEASIAESASAEATAASSSSSTSDSPLPCPGVSLPYADAQCPALAVPKVTSAISMTAALKNVGAIISLNESLPEAETAAVIQSEKKLILQRLNQNLKAQSSVVEVKDLLPVPAHPNPITAHPVPVPTESVPAGVEDQCDTDEGPSSNQDRKNWEHAEKPILPVAQLIVEEKCTQTNESPEDRPPSGGDRKKWEAGVPLVLAIAKHTLGETCMMTIETTGEVLQTDAEVPRKVWKVGPDYQVLKVLQEAELQPLTQQLQSVTFCKTEGLSPDHLLQPPAASADSELIPKEELTSVDQIKSQPVVPDHSEPQDVESVVLEDVPKHASDPPVTVQPAWEQEGQQHMPLGGDTASSVTKETEKSAESDLCAVVQHEEPLFMKLCSPAHRRTAALAVLSAQSSMDESTSSLASRSRSVSPQRSKHQDALLIGLSTGMFDANNPRMLCTCSLPDLSQIFSSQQDSAVTGEASTVQDNNLDIEEIENLDDAAKDDDQSETEDVYEDEDLRDIRASMERLLQEESDMAISQSEVGDGDFNGNPPVNRDQELLDDIAAEMEKENHRMAVDIEEDDDDEEEEEDEEDEECSNGSPGDEDAGELLSNGVGEEMLSNNGHLNEEWHSDGSDDDQEKEAKHHESIFSRLEELRFNLEQQMGFERFIEAYNKIKAIHEDEDENIDLGSGLVLSILGTEHQHLYPNILHLVMADGAYQEGNDE
ncbi:serine/threonine-protein kinase Nek1 isoform X2 [Gouania willdenowi]|uniref:serine/threonine-protein kinase Nek1 isoform X2 n=1 Tax=Gouania willdenowi TaxID=441366 RepID=UPI001054CC25|nr:serine/threonine-protein kinase Nek1 isoform X2 [Gouania willdenowi]